MTRLSTIAASVPLTTHDSTLFVLLHLIDQADRGKPDSLLPFLNPTEIDELRQMPIKDLLRLADQRQPILNISVDTGQLRLCMRRLRNRDGTDADKLWFVRRGAPQILMAHLFGATEREFRALRRSAGLQGRPGRPATVDAETEILVLAQWGRSNGEPSLVKRYRGIADAFPALSLATLHKVIIEGMG
jgi:hypothetical protein